MVPEDRRFPGVSRERLEALGGAGAEAVEGTVPRAGTRDET